MKINMVFNVTNPEENQRAKDLVWYFEEFIEEVVGLELSTESIEFVDNKPEGEIIENQDHTQRGGKHHESS